MAAAFSSAGDEASTYQLEPPQLEALAEPSVFEPRNRCDGPLAGVGRSVGLDRADDPDPDRNRGDVAAE